MAGFRAFQSSFAARIRDPKAHPRPTGVPARRMRVYEELLYNNIDSFLLACYPITRQILGVRAWRRTVKTFFAEYRSHSPLFRDIPRGFLDWLAPRTGDLFPHFPWLGEFMTYEWLELDVVTSPEEVDWNRIDPQGDLLDGMPVLDPTARLACFAYPVHRIGPRRRPKVPGDQPHCFAIFRDASDQARFIELTPVLARLLELLLEGGASGREAVARLGREIDYPDLPRLENSALEMLSKLRSEGVLLGVSR